MTIAAFIFGGLQVAQGFGSGQLAQEQANAQASFLEAQAIQVEKQLDRERSDLEREQGALRSRSRAVLAASGADTASGTGLAILESQASRGARSTARLEDDAAISALSLRSQARNVRSVGDIQKSQQIFGGFTNAGQTAFSFFSPSPTVV